MSRQLGRNSWRRHPPTNRPTMNNRRVVACVIAGVLALGVTVVVTQTRDSSMRRYPRFPFGEVATVCRPSTFVLRTKLPAMPSAVRVYRVERRAPTNAEFLKLVEALPITLSPEDEAWLLRSEHAPEPRPQKYEPLGRTIGDWEIHLYPGGQYSLRNLPLRKSLRGRDAQAPSVEEVRRVADTFLSRTGLLPAGAHFAKVHDVEVEVRDVDDKVVRSRGVRYQCFLEEIPAGSFTVVVGPGGEIASVGNGMRRVIPEEPLPILSPREGLQKLQSKECQVRQGPSWVATAYVDSVRLVYPQGPLAIDLSYIMPVYVFEGEAVAAGKRTVRWAACVEAVRPEFLETKPADE